jgi:hypothetical protein
MKLKNKSMDTKIKLLKDLGFSDDFIDILNKDSVNNNLDSSNSIFSSFESIENQVSDFNSLIIEKSEEPLNVYTFSH